jgi:hypothetical protein
MSDSRFVVRTFVVFVGDACVVVVVVGVGGGGSAIARCRCCRIGLTQMTEHSNITENAFVVANDEPNVQPVERDRCRQ